jgi:carbamoylphosphate synthase large subunit
MKHNAEMQYKTDAVENNSYTIIEKPFFPFQEYETDCCPDKHTEVICLESITVLIFIAKAETKLECTVN